MVSSTGLHDFCAVIGGNPLVFLASDRASFLSSPKIVGVMLDNQVRGAMFFANRGDLVICGPVADRKFKPLPLRGGKTNE